MPSAENRRQARSFTCNFIILNIKMSDDLFSPNPFWFASDELLTNVLRVEINEVTQLHAKHAELGPIFEATSPTVAQRTECFTVLAHAKLVEMIGDELGNRYLEGFPLSGEESKALASARSLVAPDAPMWVQEMSGVVEQLSSHVHNGLPELLRRTYADDAARVEAIKSATVTHGSVEQIQSLIGGVLQQQLRRLEQRWPTPIVQVKAPKKRKILRTRNRWMKDRDRVIAEIAQVASSPADFVRIMDARNVEPQPTWLDEWPGTWALAYKNPRLRKLIHQDKSRALSRIGTQRRT